jgi:hypothetical protein
MLALVLLALIANVVHVGYEKCKCERTDLKRKNPKQYMKRGIPGGIRQWCEECPNVPPEARYLNNTVCRVRGCKGTTLWALVGTRDDGLCGHHHKKLPEEEQALYEDVLNKRCACGNFAVHAIVSKGKTHKTTSPTHCGPCVTDLPVEEREKYVDVVSKRCECDGCGNRAINAIVLEGETYKTTSPTHCGKCVKKLPKEDCEKYEDVCNKRCEHDGCKTRPSYAEDFKGFPRRFCASHAPTHFVCTSMKPCRGPGDGTGCPRNGTIHKNKSGGQCVWCDPNGNAKRYEIAVLDRLKELGYDFMEQYKIYDAVDVAQRVRSRFIHSIDGIILFDGIVIAIEVDEKGSHHQEEADERRMRICEEYLEEEHGVGVAWIRIVPNITGGKKVLGDGCEQFGEKAVKIREKIVDEAAATIEKLLENPESGEFYF